MAQLWGSLQLKRSFDETLDYFKKNHYYCLIKASHIHISQFTVLLVQK